MINRLYALPEELITLIWKHYYNIVLENMNDRYFIKEWFDSNKKIIKKNKKYITWSEYYNNLNTGGMIFRNLSYRNVPIWLRNKGCNNYSGCNEIQKYMYDCWYKFEYWYLYDDDSDDADYNYEEYSPQSGDISLASIF